MGWEIEIRADISGGGNVGLQPRADVKEFSD